MNSTSIRRQLLQKARQHLQANEALAPNERDSLLALLDVLFALAEQEYKGESAGAFLKQVSTNFLAASQLLSIIQHQREELQILHNLGTSIVASLDLSTVLENIVTEALRLVKHARTAHIFLYENGQLHFGAASFQPNSPTHKPFSRPRTNGLTATVARSGKAITVADIRNHPLFENTPKNWYGSIVGIPLLARNRVVGVMNLSRHITGPFNPRELHLLNLLASHAAIAIENARLHQLVLKQAKRDMLTGLPNRRALDEKLEQEIERAHRHQHTFSILMLDLDGFKEINDTYGHEIGDQVLQQVATVLSANLRNIDFLARWGGDEMALVLPETPLEQGLVVGQKLQFALQQAKIHISGGQFARLQFSGGIAEYPQHGNHPADLLRAADAALYRAKKKARGSIMIARTTIQRRAHQT